MDPLDPRLHIIPNVPRRHLPHEAVLNWFKDARHQFEDHEDYRHREHPTAGLHPRPDQGALPTSLSWIQDRWHPGTLSEAKQKIVTFFAAAGVWREQTDCPVPRVGKRDWCQKVFRSLWGEWGFCSPKYYLNCKEILQLLVLVLENEWSDIRTWGCYSWTFFHQQQPKPISECQFLSEPSPIIALPCKLITHSVTPRCETLASEDSRNLSLLTSWVITWICQKRYVGFKVVLCISRPLPYKTKL